MTAWSEIVNHEGSDEWMQLCNAALAEIKQVQTDRLRGAVESRIYEALVTFNATACWPILQHAQNRQYLAEHIAQALTGASDTSTEPPRPSADHQAIYLDSHDQVWCDYPTVPAGDDVLPLVWASEVAQSRSDLEADGNKLRVIGWCR